MRAPPDPAVALARRARREIAKARRETSCSWQPGRRPDSRERRAPYIDHGPGCPARRGADDA
jgi:hypothetical protein